MISHSTTNIKNEKTFILLNKYQKKDDKKEKNIWPFTNENTHS